MTESIYISKLKKAATKLRKQEQIKHSEALDKVAQQAGFIGWHDLMNTPKWILEGCFFGVDPEFSPYSDLQTAPFEELSGKDLEDVLNFLNKTPDDLLDFKKLRLFRFTTLTDVQFCDFKNIDSIGETTNLIGHFWSYLSVMFISFKGNFYTFFPYPQKLHKVTRKIKTPRGYKEIVDCYRELLIPHELEERQDISPEEIEDALNEKVCCLHCGAEYPYRETKIIVDEFGDEFTVCKNFPECDGHDMDLMPAGYENM